MKAPKKSLRECLASCRKEEEVKAEFCKFFKMKIFALRGIDHYTEEVLFEFKYDRNLKSAGSVARILAQVAYYARMLKFGAGLVRYPVPPYICVVDKNEAFFAETAKYARFYTSKSDRYDWDRAPSTPCPKLEKDIAAVPAPYVYDLDNPAEEAQFVEKCRQRLESQGSFFNLLDKKAITEENFLDVFDYWNALFEPYVKNGRKPSEYFFADIEQGKSVVSPDGRILFSVSGAEGLVPKTIQPEKYSHFWQNYEKVSAADMARIRQKSDRLTEDFRRRFNGEFYTPLAFAAKGLDYLERTIGREWWKSGEYRFWDMAAGTGNLEFPLPSSALPYCYISTLDEEDARYCRKIFPAATCFQYDYLRDDVPALAGQMTYGQKLKMPANLAADLANPGLKWIIFINPPFATANTRGGETGKKSKDAVSMTTLREWMNDEGYGEASRELFTQFLFRISKEFKNRRAHLCLYAPLKYINSNNDQKIRDGFFQYKFERGFAFSSRNFYGASGNFAVGFLVWDLARCAHLSKQRITIDVFDDDGGKIGKKRILSIGRQAMLNKWCPRPRWDGKSIMPTFVSPLNMMTDNKDQRNHIAKGYLFSVVSKGDDMQNQGASCLLSTPYANAGAFSATPDNFEKAMALFAVKRMPAVGWTNNKDVFYAPREEPPAEFVADCVVWSAFAGSNYSVALRNVEYKGAVWQIRNNLYPFLLREARRWKCSHGDVEAQLAAANEDRFLAKWLAQRDLSPEAVEVLSAGKALYRAFYADMVHTPWMDYRIETWDAGFYQIRGALKKAGAEVRGRTEPIAEKLRAAHDALRDKLLPQIYDLGFLNPDVEYFK